MFNCDPEIPSQDEANSGTPELQENLAAFEFPESKTAEPQHNHGKP